MTKLEQIEKTVAELEGAEFKAFSAWFEALQAERWDRQLKSDIDSGKLAEFADQALAEFRARKTTLL